MTTKGYYKTRVTDEGRVCTICGKFKPWSAFDRNCEGTKGHHSYCRVCRRKKWKEGYTPKWRIDADGRQCTACEQYRPWSEFDRASNSKTGHCARCKDCLRKIRGHKKAKVWRITDQGRECTRCGRFLSWEHFNKNKCGTRGYQSWCSGCFREYQGRTKRRDSLITEEGRECSRCGVFKTWDHYHNCKSRATGHASACKACMRQKTRQDMENGTIRDGELRRKYDISLSEYERMAEENGDACAICGTMEKGRARGRVRYWSVDHDHETGEIRGLLCQKCNSLLGMADDDIEILQKAIAYLELYRERAEPIPEAVS